MVVVPGVGHDSLHNAPIERVSLLHTDVQQFERIFQAAKRFGELVLGGPAVLFEGCRPVVGK